MKLIAGQNAQKLKLLLIPVLALTLGGVVFWPAEEDAADDASATTLASPAAISSSTAPSGTLPNAELWKGVDLSQATQFNPFAPLNDPLTVEPNAAETAAGAATGESEASVAAGKQVTRNVLAVIHRDGKAYACIDNEVATVGDTLADGARVVAVTADTVVLETSP